MTDSQAFVPYTAPGDEGIFKVRGEAGRLHDLTEASPHRQEPRCSHYGVCGGCSLQHVSETFYASWKHGLVVDALKRAGIRDVSVDDIIPTSTATRRRAGFAIKEMQDGFKVGFKRKASHQIVPIEDCIVLHEAVKVVMARLPAAVLYLDETPTELFVTRCDNGLDLDVKIRRGASVLDPAGLADWMRANNCVRFAMNGETELQLEPPMINLSGFGVSIPPRAFLQASKDGEAILTRLVLEGIGDALKIADLFCGVGTFSIPMAATRTVLGVDSAGAALAALEAAIGAAQRRGASINPVRTERRNLFERPLQPDELNKFDAVVFDPPRAGAKAQAECLAASLVPLVVGVSCNPATFARDAALLTQGGYSLRRVTPVDQFVYAAHVELVGVFAKE